MRFFRNERAGNAFPRMNGFRKAPPELDAGMRHKVSPDLTTAIREAVYEQQSRCLNRAGAEKDRLAMLTILQSRHQRGDACLQK